VVDNEPLELQFSIPKSTVLDMDLIESSFDLMTNPLFTISKRASWMMPTPFILNDAVVIKEKIKATAKVIETTASKYKLKFVTKKDSLFIVKDSLQNP
jgi:hypothetical protein